MPSENQLCDVIQNDPSKGICDWHSPAQNTNWRIIFIYFMQSDWMDSIFQLIRLGGNRAGRESPSASSNNPTSPLPLQLPHPLQLGVKGRKRVHVLCLYPHYSPCNHHGRLLPCPKAHICPSTFFPSDFLIQLTFPYTCQDISLSPTSNTQSHASHQLLICRHSNTCSHWLPIYRICNITNIPMYTVTSV